MVEQSAPLCIILGCTSGLLEVLSRTVVAYPVHIERRNGSGDDSVKSLGDDNNFGYDNDDESDTASESSSDVSASGKNKSTVMTMLPPGKKFPPSFHKAMMVLNVVLQILSTFFAGASSFYGPVSVDLPILLGSEVVFSLLLFGPLLHIEVFTRTMWIGTGLTLVGMSLLPILGPQIQDDQDILSMLARPHAVAWSSLLVAGLLWSAVCLVLAAIRGNAHNDRGGLRPKTMYTAGVIMTAQLTEAVVSTTLSKMFVLVDGAAFWIAFVAYVASVSVALYAFILQSTAVTQGIFVPIFASGTIFVNGITGLIVWEDANAVHSWVGYGLVFVLLLIGNFLVALEDPNHDDEHDERDCDVVKFSSEKAEREHDDTIALTGNKKTRTLPRDSFSNDKTSVRKRAAR